MNFAGFSHGGGEVLFKVQKKLRYLARAKCHWAMCGADWAFTVSHTKSNLEQSSIRAAIINGRGSGGYAPQSLEGAG